jgi:hypothetical protein
MTNPPDDPLDLTPAPEEGGGGPAALAATEQPVDLSVKLVPDERVPDGMVCMGTFRGERLVARCVLPPEAWGEIEEFGLFDDPVPVVLVAREAPPGLQCQLFALLPVPEGATDEDEDDEGDDDDEPWAASVPGAGYEAAAEAAAEEEEEDEEEEDEEAGEGEEDDVQVIAFPLGNIVRYDRDRVHPDSLPLEAADVLRKIIEGRTTEVVDRALADLFGIEPPDGRPTST